MGFPGIGKLFLWTLITFVVRDRVILFCSPDCLRTHYINQAAFKLRFVYGDPLAFPGD